jgi:hypothetical protein
MMKVTFVQTLITASKVMLVSLRSNPECVFIATVIKTSIQVKCTNAIDPPVITTPAQAFILGANEADFKLEMQFVVAKNDEKDRHCGKSAF